MLLLRQTCLAGLVGVSKNAFAYVSVYRISTCPTILTYFNINTKKLLNCVGTKHIQGPAVFTKILHSNVLSNELGVFIFKYDFNTMISS